MVWGGGGCAPFCVLMSLKRRVSTALGRVAQPKNPPLISKYARTVHISSGRREKGGDRGNCYTFLSKLADACKYLSG